jgi:hypothetical protein
MTYKLPKWRSIGFAIVSPLIYFMTLLSIVALLTSRGHLLKSVVAVICFSYVSYLISVSATSISIDEEIISFKRMINEKQIETGNVISIHRSKLIGCLVFKSTAGNIWVIEGIKGIKDIIQTIKANNPAVNVFL